MSVATTTSTTGRGGVGDWRHQAACRDHVDPELFHPAADWGPVFEAQVAAAKAVCAGCAVRAQCLEFARTLPYGIAGGMTRPSAAATITLGPRRGGSPRVARWAGRARRSRPRGVRRSGTGARCGRWPASSG